MMKRKVSLLLTLALVLALVMVGCGGSEKPAAQAPAPADTSNSAAAPAAPSKPSGKVTKFAIGTGSTGSNFFLAGSAVSALVNEKLGGMYESSVEVTAASAGNIALLQAGEIAFGWSATDTAWEAYYGKYSYDGDVQNKIRTVCPAYSGVYMFITTPATGVNNVTDFNGKAYSCGTNGSANSTMTNRVFEMFGINATTTNLPNTEAATGLADGTLSGFTHSYPSSVLAEFETTHDSKIITLTEEQKNQFLEKYPQYLWLEIPGGVYKGLPDGGWNLGLYSMLISSVDTDEEMVYQMTKLIYENHEYWVTAYPQMAKDVSLDKISSTTIPYHAGAIRYFKEAGIDVPDELIPPECK